MFFKKSWFKSFTLIELSVVLFVIAILSTMGIGIYKKMDTKDAADARKINEINLALQRFFALNKRLPRPADLKTLMTSPNFGNEVDFGVNPGYRGKLTGAECLNEIARVENYLLRGGVPVKTLGLPKEYAMDSHGNWIEFFVLESSTRVLGVYYPNLCNGKECKFIGMVSSRDVFGSCLPMCLKKVDLDGFGGGTYCNDNFSTYIAQYQDRDEKKYYSYNINMRIGFGDGYYDGQRESHMHYAGFIAVSNEKRSCKLYSPTNGEYGEGGICGYYGSGDLIQEGYGCTLYGCGFNALVPNINYSFGIRLYKVLLWSELIQKAARINNFLAD